MKKYMKNKKTQVAAAKIGLLLFLFFALGFSSAALVSEFVSDDAGLFSGQEKLFLEKELQSSPDSLSYQLCIKTGNTNTVGSTGSSKNISQAVSQTDFLRDAINYYNSFSFNKNCDILLYITKNPKEINKKSTVSLAIVQPEAKILLDDEIKKIIINFEERKTRPAQGAVQGVGMQRRGIFFLVNETLSELEKLLSNTPIKSDACTKLKDGICDKQCPGSDLDCLCGNGVCEYFEKETCTEDCKKGWQCAVISDSICHENCIVKDLDCRIKSLSAKINEIRAGNKEGNKISGTVFAWAGILAVLLLIGICIYFIHTKIKQRDEQKAEQQKTHQNIFSGKKGEIDVSIQPSKVFTYIFLLVVSVVGMGLFIAVATEGSAQANLPPRSLTYMLGLERLLSSPECFSFVNQETNIPDSGLIDLQKFTQKNLDNCYIVEADATGKECFRLTLYTFDETGQEGGQKKERGQIQTKNFPLCYTKEKMEKQAFIARVYENGITKRGLIQVEAKKVT